MWMVFNIVAKRGRNLPKSVISSHPSKSISHHLYLTAVFLRAKFYLNSVL